MSYTARGRAPHHLATCYHNNNITARPERTKATPGHALTPSRGIGKDVSRRRPLFAVAALLAALALTVHHHSRQSHCGCCHQRTGCCHHDQYVTAGRWKRGCGMYAHTLRTTGCTHLGVAGTGFVCGLLGCSKGLLVALTFPLGGLPRLGVSVSVSAWCGRCAGRLRLLVGWLRRGRGWSRLACVTVARGLIN